VSYDNAWSVHVPNGFQMKGGWIVQDVSLTRTVAAASGSPLPGDNLTVEYWEAWPVDSSGNLKSIVSFRPPADTVDPNGPDDRDENIGIDGEDHFDSHPKTAPSSGTVEWMTTAYFYPNLQLPATFTKDGGGSWAGDLPSTKTDPGLTPPVGEVGVTREYKETWDSISDPASTPTVDDYVLQEENGQIVQDENGVQTVVP
jgi:hypothetical protein